MTSAYLPLFAHDSGPTGSGFDVLAMGAGAALRVAQALLEAAPYLLIGAAVAGVLRGMVGAAALRSFFGKGHWSAAFRALGVGFLLPLSSLGVLPVAHELRRAGVPRSAVLTFSLAASLLNPLSVVYGLTLVEPGSMALILLASLVVAVGAGLACGRDASETSSSAGESGDFVPGTSIGRLAQAALSFSQAWVSPAFVFLLLGLAGTALPAVFLPHGFFQSRLSRQSPLAPLLIAPVVFPAYAPSLEGMRRAGTLLRDGFSPGAAWLVLALGVGTDAGSLAWVASAYGKRAAVRLIAALLVLSLTFAYAAQAFVPGAVAEADHTHSLDDLTRPAFAGSGREILTAAWDEVRREVRQPEQMCLAALALVCVIGAVSLAAGVRVPSANRDPRKVLSEPTRPRWNPALTGRTLGLAVGLVVMAVSVSLVYVYYPEPKELFEEMDRARDGLSVAVTLGTPDEALEAIQRFRRSSEKLAPAEVLRRGRLSTEQRQCAEELAYSLDGLRDCVANGRREEAVALLQYTRDAYRSCRRAFEVEPPAPTGH